ncbi:MAG: aminoglycoside phosphotransferase family protein [Sediminibacterium sp.]|nr:aminoglycoside phosphotransferase family protein [Sediminibacterium sp.]TXT32216.1 MAG: aminoglycoside phosphotransferase [Chitinophagaceae bacterium]
MNEQECKEVIQLYGWNNASVTNINSGLINHTFKITSNEGVFILQEINTAIFQQPKWIDENICLIANYLQKTAPNYLFTVPIPNLNGDTITFFNHHAFRAFLFQPNSHTYLVVQNENEALEASKQFAQFTQHLNSFNARKLHITLPHFHNLSLRFADFEKSLRENNSERLVLAAPAANALLKMNNIVNRYEAFIAHPDAMIRVMHHDTKISNILFNEKGEGLCVIDLDTVMPGYLFSDPGDMFRTYLSPVSEEEADLSKIYIRKDIFEAIEKGYLGTIKSALNSFEIDNFYLSGEILIYMQAIRFLTDFLHNDRYYGEKYPNQNLVRAENQLRLLELYQEAIC